MSIYNLANQLPLDASPIPPPRAPQACLSCRKQKRKCNKGIPACSLCERMNRPCDYSDALPAPTSDDFMALRQRLAELEGRLNGGPGSGMTMIGSRGGSMALGHGGAGGMGLGGMAMGNSPYTPASSGMGMADERGGTMMPSYQEEMRQVPLNRFPAIAFLDSDAFKYGGIAVPKPSISIPIVSHSQPLTRFRDVAVLDTSESPFGAQLPTYSP